MTSELKVLNDGREGLTINAQWPEVAADYDDLLSQYSRLALPGFRPGKAPRAVIEQRFQKEIRNDFTASCGRRLARQALREQGLCAAGPIKVVEIQFEPRREFRFVAEFVPVPKLELPDYTGVALTGTTDDERRDELSLWLLEHTAWDPPGALIREECIRNDQGVAEAGSDAWEAAGKRVKLMIILEQIAKAEGLESGEQDVDARLEKMAGDYSVQPAELRRQLGEDGVSRLRSLLCAEQTLAYLMSIRGTLIPKE